MSNLISVYAVSPINTHDSSLFYGVFCTHQQAEDFLKFEEKGLGTITQRWAVQLDNGRIVFVDPNHPLPYELNAYTLPDQERIRREALAKLTLEERQVLGI